MVRPRDPPWVRERRGGGLIHEGPNACASERMTTGCFCYAEDEKPQWCEETLQDDRKRQGEAEESGEGAPVDEEDVETKAPVA